MYQLSPSILAADFTHLGEDVSRAEKAGADLLHIDVMDGCFVPSISFGMPLMKSLKRLVRIPFDVHLMIEDPIRYVAEMRRCGADILTVHYEACRHLHSTVMEIKKHGMKAGVAINPATPVEALRYILQEADMVLVMTVNPGFGGQKLISATLDKIRDLKKMMLELNVNPDIQVDGGITLGNLGQVMEAGANVIVTGTSIFAGNIEENIRQFKEIFANALG